MASGRSTPVVLSFWHDRSFYLAYHLRRKLLSRGFPITILMSQSKDGELGGKLARRLGADVERGSASRGGSAGLRRLYRAVTRRASSPVLVPDGPRGPCFQAKAGAVVLAQMARIPVQPLAYAAERCWRLNSWDRLVIPKPFSRVRLAWGEPLTVPPSPEGGGGAELLEEHRRELETSLQRLTEELEESFRPRPGQAPEG